MITDLEHAPDRPEMERLSSHSQVGLSAPLAEIMRTSVDILEVVACCEDEYRDLDIIDRIGRDDCAAKMMIMIR